jgi:deoxyribonuclease IV
MAKETDAPLIGCHVSIAGGVDQAPLNGQTVGCRTVQIFTKSNRQWNARPLRDEEIAGFFANCKATDIGPVIAHSAYLINLAAVDKAMYKKSWDAMLIELQRAEALKLPGLVLHPGAHGGSGEEAAIRQIANALNDLIDATPKAKVKILLETTAGQGTCVGHRFEHLADIISKVRRKSRIGVCFDTCHVFAAGYDIRTEKTYHATMEAFDNIIGIKRLVCFHLNDSKGDLGSRLDRHEQIGHGKIGRAGFRSLMQDPRLSHIPKLLETPKGMKGKTEWDIVNLRLLRKMAAT